MIQKIKRLFLSNLLLLTMLVPVTLTMPLAMGVAEACNGVATNVATGASAAASTNIDCTAGSGETNDAETSIKTIAGDVVKIFAIIVGAVSVFMIIYGGFRYITSGGDSGKVGNAKNTLIYAIIGLIIVALAEVIVHFVLSGASTEAAPLGT